VAQTVEVVKVVEALAVSGEDSLLVADGEALPVAGEDPLSVTDGEALPVAGEDCPSVAVTGQMVV